MCRSCNDGGGWDADANYPDNPDQHAAEQEASMSYAGADDSRQRSFRTQTQDKKREVS